MALRRYPGKKIVTELDDEPVRLPMTDKHRAIGARLMTTTILLIGFVAINLLLYAAGE